MKSFERRLFQLLHPEVIVGSFHSLKRANNTRNWTKTALNNCIKIVNDVMSQVLGNLRTTTTTLSTTTRSEIQCTAQARLANFVVVVSSTTPNTVQSRRPASQASAGINPLFLGYFLSVLCIFLSS